MKRILSTLLPITVVSVIPIFLLLLLVFPLVSSSSSSELHSLLSLKSSLTDPSQTLQDWNTAAAAATTKNDDDVDYEGVQLHHQRNPTTTITTTSAPPYCSWSGIQCDDTDSHHHITSLDLSSRNLSGSIPSSIEHLTWLTHLNLSHNSFTGPLPSTIFDHLTRLQTLDINHNSFDSAFPSPGVSRLTSLTYLDCYSNSFTGSLPADISGHPTLQHLNLGGSYFEGPIPGGYGNLPNLTFLYLAGNSINGSIPPELGDLAELQRLEIGYNGNLSGTIPSELGKLSKLTYLDISTSNLSGPIPWQILTNLTSLQTLLLFRNKLRGTIPVPAAAAAPPPSSSSQLSVLDLSNNLLTGSIPESLATFHPQLTLLSLMNNFLTGSIPDSVGDLRNLSILHLWNNSLTGPLPSRLGANSNLVKLDVSSNQLTGAIPPHLCTGNRLLKLLLFSNKFNSTFPTSLTNCTHLSRVRVQNNQLTGPIPVGFGSLPNLTFLDLSCNNFTGPIPGDLVNSITLGTLNLSGNSFVNSNLPSKIWRMKNLQVFSASGSQLTGRIPRFDGCESVYRIELSGNRLSGTIPWDVGDCMKLNSLDLSGNELTGIIPWEISGLPAISYVDLSMNRLNGSIPEVFGNCSTLESFNVSYNQLVGVIPEGGPIFSHLHPSSFRGNVDLCGKLVGRECQGGGERVVDDDDDDDGGGGVGSSEVVWITAVVFGVCMFVLLAGIRCFQNEPAATDDDDNNSSSARFRFGFGFGSSGRRRSRTDNNNSSMTLSSSGNWKLTAFQRLTFTADDVLGCLAMSDKVIGMGSTGTVYRAEMPSGEVIAVKKLWGATGSLKQQQQQQQQPTINGWRRVGARQVLAEVDVLGTVRHRNIVRLLGCCSNKETTMLLYEYMPNGSLEDLLHGRRKAAAAAAAEGYSLADWLIRYKIALGVAQGICYLHHDCDPLIVHRDVKPSNILLDDEMEARVADFGVAKLIQAQGCCKESMSVVAGSYGYIAPEYAYTLQVDEKSDIYSYGVVLLEILTGRRSVDPEFGDGNTIVDWVRAKIKAGGVAGVGVLSLLLDDKAGAAAACATSVKDEMTLVLKVALICTSKNPADRPSMRDVVSMLQEARPQTRKVVVAGVTDGNGNQHQQRHHHVISMNGIGGCTSTSTSTSMADCSTSLEGKELVTC